jgi:predicted PurR-regulated permease PerM
VFSPVLARDRSGIGARYHAGMAEQPRAAGADPGDPTSSNGLVLTSRQRRWLDVLLVCATVIAFLIAVALTWDAVLAFGDIIGIFFLAWLIAFVIGPLANALVRVIPALPKAVAVVVVYVAIFIALFGLLFVVTQTLVASINDFIDRIPQIKQDLPAILAPIQQFVDSLGLSIDIQVQLQQVLDLIRTRATEILGPLQQLAVAGIGVMGNVLIIVILSLYIAVDRDRILAFLLRLVPPGYKEEADLLRRSVSKSFGGFIRGMILLGLAYAAVAAVTSLLLGLDLAPLTTIAAGILMAIPFFGPFVAWLPPVLVAIFFDQAAIIPTIVIMGAGWFVVMNILQPRVMSGAVGLHPVVVLGAVIIGTKVGGIAGAIFAIPVAAIVSAFFFYYLGQARSGSVTERAARRVEDRQRRRVRVPREPMPGHDLDVTEETLGTEPVDAPAAPDASLARPSQGG